MLENKNLILAVVLSVAILFVFNSSRRCSIRSGHRFRPPPRPRHPVRHRPAPRLRPLYRVRVSRRLEPKPVWRAPSAVQSHAQVLAQTPRIRINTPALHGSIALVGGRIDDVTLARYRETLDPDSPEIVLFSPLGSADPYFAETGWVAAGGGAEVPGPKYALDRRQRYADGRHAGDAFLG